MTIKVKYIGFSFLLVFLMGLGACKNNAEQAPSNPTEGDTTPSQNQIFITNEQFRSSEMELGRLQEITFSNTINATGMVDVPPEFKTSVSPYFGGYIQEIKLLPGQKVRKGERLFTLKNPEYIRLQQDFLEAKSKLAYLKEDYERQKTLNQENIASRKDFLKAKSDYEVTLARFEAMKMKLLMLNIDPESLNESNIRSSVAIYSPISGYITQINNTKGQFVKPSDVAVKLVNTDHLHFELNIFEKNLPWVEKGQPVTFYLPDYPELIYEGEIFLVGKTVDTNTRKINIHAHLKNENQKAFFAPGMYIEAKIETQPQKALALPLQAVVNDEGTDYVLVKAGTNENGIYFEKKQVKVGRSHKGMAQVLNTGDLKGDEDFLIKGAFNLI